MSASHAFELAGLERLALSCISSDLSSIPDPFHRLLSELPYHLLKPSDKTCGASDSTDYFQVVVDRGEAIHAALGFGALKRARSGTSLSSFVTDFVTNIGRQLKDVPERRVGEVLAAFAAALEAENGTSRDLDGSSSRYSSSAGDALHPDASFSSTGVSHPKATSSTHVQSRLRPSFDESNPSSGDYVVAPNEVTHSSPDQASDDCDDVEYNYSDDEDGDEDGDEGFEQKPQTDTSSLTAFDQASPDTALIENHDSQRLESHEAHSEQRTDEVQQLAPSSHVCVDYFLRVATVFAREGGFSADAWPLLGLCRDTWNCAELTGLVIEPRQGKPVLLTSGRLVAAAAKGDIPRMSVLLNALRTLDETSSRVLGVAPATSSSPDTAVSRTLRVHINGTALSHACAGGHIEAARLLLSHGASLSMDQLVGAAAKGRAALLQDILQSCTGPASADLLLATASHGQVAAMKVLLEYQRKWHRTGDYRGVVLRCMDGPVSPARADMTLAVISVTETLSDSDMNSVIIWARSPHADGVAEALALVSFIIARGAELGRNLAAAAAMSRSAAELLPLLEVGGVDAATAKTPDAKGKNVPLLEAACSFGAQADVVSELLRRGAVPSCEALGAALRAANSVAALMLLEAGADPLGTIQGADVAFHKPASIVFKHGPEHVAIAMLERLNYSSAFPPPTWMLEHAATAGFSKVCDKLLLQGAPPTHTAFRAAAVVGSHHVLRSLCDASFASGTIDLDQALLTAAEPSAGVSAGTLLYIIKELGARPTRQTLAHALRMHVSRPGRGQVVKCLLQHSDAALLSLIDAPMFDDKYEFIWSPLGAARFEAHVADAAAAEHRQDDPRTYTALDFECFVGGPCIIALLEHGASPSLPGLLAALRRGTSGPAITALIQRLVEYGLDLDEPVGGDARDTPLLLFAVRMVNAPAALTLLQLGASPTRAAAEAASRAGFVEVLSAILDRACPALDPAELLTVALSSAQTGSYAPQAGGVISELLRRGAVATTSLFETTCDKLNAGALEALLIGASFARAAQGHPRAGSSARTALLSCLLDRACAHAPAKHLRFDLVATLRVLMRAGATPSASTLHALCSTVPVPADVVLGLLEAPGCRSLEPFEAGLLLERVCRGASSRGRDAESERAVGQLVRLLTSAAATAPSAGCVES